MSRQGPHRNSTGRCIFKENNSCPAALTFWIAPWGTHFPGFEKLPVVAFTFGVFAASFVQERWIQNCFPVYLSQVWTPFMSVFGPRKWLPLKHSNIAADTRPPVWQPEIQQWKQSNGQPATARTRVYLCCKAAAKAAEKAFVVQLCRAVVLRTCCTAGLLGCRASSVRMLRLCSQKTGR